MFRIFIHRGVGISHQQDAEKRDSNFNKIFHFAKVEKKQRKKIMTTFE